MSVGVVCAYAGNKLPLLPFRSTSVLLKPEPKRTVTDEQMRAVTFSAQNTAPTMGSNYNTSSRLRLWQSSSAVLRSVSGPLFDFGSGNHVAHSASTGLTEYATGLMSRDYRLPTYSSGSTQTGSIYQPYKSLRDHTPASFAATTTMPSLPISPLHSGLYAMATSTILRAGEVIWGNQVYDEDGNLIGYLDGDNVRDKDTHEIIGKWENGTFTTQGEPVDTPVGSPLCLIPFALTYAFIKHRKSRKNEDTMILTIYN